MTSTTAPKRHRPRPKWLALKISELAAKATPTDCPTCGAPILAGLDGDTLAFPARVDAAPVTQCDELRALMAGRATYWLINGEINRRGPMHVAGPNSTRFPIHLEHRCPGGTP